MQQDKDEEVLVLASLLHDIGKVKVRHDNNKNHAEHGYDMLMEIAESSPNKDFMKRVADLVKYHHTKPENTGLADKDKELLRILKDADCKSAAHERDDRDAPVQKDGPYLDKMSTYLSLKDLKQTKPNRTHFYVQSEQDMLKILEGKSGNSGYKQLDEDIVKEIKQLNGDRFSQYIGSINSVLRNKTSFLPSAFYYSNPNIPLYDHLKISGALAICIYRSMKSENSKFMLIRTDMSGIQDYIFKYFRSEQADEKGTRRIRGRSLRVSLTTRVIVQYIVDELNLYDLNVVWLNSDGSLIIAPYSDENEQKLKEIRKNVGQYFIDHDRGITCAIEWNVGDYDIIPAVKKDQNNENEDLETEDSNFRIFMDELMGKVNMVKRRSYYEQISSGLQDFFVEKEIKPCWSCGLNNGNNDGKCDECIREEEIGLYIVKKFDSIILQRNDLGQYEGDLNFGFGNYVYSFSFMKPMGDLKSGRILYINNYPEHLKDFQIPWEIFMIGNYAPTKEEGKGGLLTINDMLKINKEKEKTNSIQGTENGNISSNEEDLKVGGVASPRKSSYLGIFKADIDNMGTLISSGFPRLTLPSYACLSRQITTFFTVKVNQIASTQRIYLVYSGGDDISALGPIDKVIEFSRILNSEFRKWMENDEITFSAGIATTHAKFPLRRGIDLAEEELAKSKSNIYNGIVKNSITVFETTMNWEVFEEMTKFKEQMQMKITGVDSNVGKNFLQRLLKMDENNPYKGGSLKGKDLNFPDHTVYYYLQRNWRGNDAERMEFMKEIVKKERYRFIRYPATYILLQERV
ncbi:MAG: type III-A CRISPR-associated protein Cas10/Csm1 [Thermoplasmatales archaeon]|nr:MAG: type III-A CRISPR-associated protein Cas10/Csm1 [Thermoplasmatales archaeon]